MLSRLDEQALVEQIEEQQQQKQINNLLRRRKKLTKGLVNDAVYNELYVDWETGATKRRRTKTQVNLNYQFLRSRLKNDKQQLPPHQKKHHSQSVQLPKISKKLEVHKAIVQQTKNSDFTAYKSNKPSIPHPRSLRRNGIGLNAALSSYQTQKNTINSEQDEKITKHNSGKLKPYQQIMTKKFKMHKVQNKGNKRMKGIKKQWLQMDILKLETYFVKLRKNKQQQVIQKVQMNNPDDVTRYDEIWFPTKQKIPDFIKSYKPTNPLIQVNDLIKRIDFKIIYDQGQCLYFGEAGEEKQTKVGIMATKNYRFQGIWTKGNKSEGYEITAQGYYKGKFKQGKRHGEGQFHWKNGQSYSGQWVKGVKHGSGMWKSGKGDTYIGQWKNGKVQGLGVHTSCHGQRYQGQFESFLKQGKGKQVFPNGDTYEGQYRKGKPNGKGKYTWKNQIVYEGDFVDGYRHGNGRIIAKNYVSFKGSFQRQKVMGYGELKFENGDEYEGQFYKGEKHGKGIMKLYSERKILSGEWKNNNYNFDDEQAVI